MSANNSNPVKESFADDNKFYILGEFDNVMKESLIVPLTKKINELGEKKQSAIEIYIGSHGGDGYVLVHLIELVEMAKRKGIIVKTIVTSHAFSSGSMLAVAGTKGERYISKMAEHIVHYGVIGTGYDHTPLQIERQSGYKKRWFNTIRSHYEKYCNIPDLENLMKDDNLSIPANKCLKWGLADKYMDEFNA